MPSIYNNEPSYIIRIRITYTKRMNNTCVSVDLGYAHRASVLLLLALIQIALMPIALIQIDR